MDALENTCIPPLEALAIPAVLPESCCVSA